MCSIAWAVRSLICAHWDNHWQSMCCSSLLKWKNIIFSEVFIINNGLLENSCHFEADCKVSLFFPQPYFTKFIYLKIFICNSKITSKTFKYENHIIVILLYSSLTIMFWENPHSLYILITCCFQSSVPKHWVYMFYFLALGKIRDNLF